MATTAGHDADVIAGRFAHLAGFFVSHTDLVANVVDFVTPALRDPQGVAVVVASSEHRAAIVESLTEGAVDPTSDRFVSLDVDAVLDATLHRGAVDRERFRTTVGGVLEPHLEAGRHVRVYAELAGRLWGRGEVTSAMRVEEVADELARERSFVLLCAYPTALFGEREPDLRGLQQVCDTHTGIVHSAPFPSRAQDGREHLGEVLQRRTVARAMDHQAVCRERDALRRSLQESADRMRAQQDLAAMVVHDVRTPATVIAGLTQVLQRRMAELPPARVADFLATIMRNTDRIERLLDDILALAQLESEGFRYDLAPIDLRGVVAQVATEIEQSTTRTVEVAADPRLPRALADADRQVQVLHNLLSNAAKFSPAGTPISVRIEPHEDHLQVHVRDEGRGIASHDLARLFEPFARLDSREWDKVSGTGLGLYVTRVLVEGQGGTIDVASAPGRGTTVTYTVPLARAG